MVIFKISIELERVQLKGGGRRNMQACLCISKQSLPVLYKKNQYLLRLDHCKHAFITSAGKK